MLETVLAQHYEQEAARPHRGGQVGMICSRAQRFPVITMGRRASKSDSSHKSDLIEKLPPAKNRRLTEPLQPLTQRPVAYGVPIKFPHARPDPVIRPQCSLLEYTSPIVWSKPLAGRSQPPMKIKSYDRYIPLRQTLPGNHELGDHEKGYAVAFQHVHSLMCHLQTIQK